MPHVARQAGSGERAARSLTGQRVWMGVLGPRSSRTSARRRFRDQDACAPRVAAEPSAAAHGSNAIAGVLNTRSCCGCRGSRPSPLTEGAAHHATVSLSVTTVCPEGPAAAAAAALPCLPACPALCGPAVGKGKTSRCQRCHWLAVPLPQRPLSQRLQLRDLRHEVRRKLRPHRRGPRHLPRGAVLTLAVVSQHAQNRV